jgi:hypothetical protein
MIITLPLLVERERGVVGNEGTRKDSWRLGKKMLMRCTN